MKPQTQSLLTKRKGSKQDPFKFTKRVKFIVHAPEVDCYDPETVTFTPNARVDHFCLEERLNSSILSNFVPQGELISSIQCNPACQGEHFEPEIFLYDTNTIAKLCSVTTVMAEDVGLIKPPTSP